MDFSSKHFSLLFLLTLFLSLQIHARENFSKFTHVVNNKENNNAANDTEVPVKVEPQNKQEEEPNFTPETQNGYGLYGHDSTKPTPTTTTTTDNPNYYYNKNEYEDSQQQDMTDTSLFGNGYTTPTSDNQDNYYNGYTRYNTDQLQQQYNFENRYNTQHQQEDNNVYNRYNPGNRYNGGNRYNTDQQQQENNVYNRYKPDNQYNGENRYNTEQQQYNNAENRYNTEQQQYSGGNMPYNMEQQNYNGGNRYNQEKQGMSDTRFMENGRYYYNINSEKNYRGGYDNKVYYGNNENSYEFDKSGEEFQENQNEYP